MAHPQIVEEFIELTRLPANSFQERVLADVLTAKLRELGCVVEEDNTGAVIGGNAGNIIARLPGSRAQAPSVLFSAHMDRVSNHGHILPRIEGDYLVSDGTSILGADDVSGICSILDGIRRVQADDSPLGDLEIVFSVAEEVGLLGVRNLDCSRLKSRLAYVIDVAGPVCTVVNQAPTQYTITVRIQGKSAHAGMEPEKGINAIEVAAAAVVKLKQGRLSPVSTSNFGVIQGGTATNIVCDYVEIKGEVRSLDSTELDQYIAEVRKVFTQTAADFGAGIELEFELEYTTFHLKEDEEVIQLAARSLKNLGMIMELTSSGGGMDGHYFNQNQIKAVGLSPAYEAVHTSKERQPLSGLIKCGELIAEIIRQAARD